MDKDKDALKKVKQKVATEKQVVEVIKGEVAENNLRTIARIKARYKAYEKVFGNYGNFIQHIALKLSENGYADNTFKELGCARLVANWIGDTEAFLGANESVLDGAEKGTRKGFVEQSLKELPEDLRKELLNNLNERKAELLEQFAKDIQIALQTARDRN